MPTGLTYGASQNKSPERTNPSVSLPPSTKVSKERGKEGSFPVTCEGTAPKVDNLK